MKFRNVTINKIENDLCYVALFTISKQDNKSWISDTEKFKQALSCMVDELDLVCECQVTVYDVYHCDLKIIFPNKDLAQEGIVKIISNGLGANAGQMLTGEHPTVVEKLRTYWENSLGQQAGE
jgi:hypothetical protein